MPKNVVTCFHKTFRKVDAMTYIFYNPQSGNKHGKEDAEKLLSSLNNDASIEDIREYDGNSEFFTSLTENDSIIICGGDGTLNHFINAHNCNEIRAEISYRPIGSGNDFANDIGFPLTTDYLPIKKYLLDLPTVEVDGKTYKFLNNASFGIDGYCCQIGDIKKQKSDKPINYTAIAIRGVLFDYKPCNATITVDGVTKQYKKVWLAPSMKGRYFGGGMMATPNQNRLNQDKKLSILIFHDSGKLRLLSIFPKIFKGTHIKHKKYVEILSGHEITVAFDRPSPMQIDGETILDVSTYTAKAFE